MNFIGQAITSILKEKEKVKLRAAAKSCWSRLECVVWRQKGEYRIYYNKMLRKVLIKYFCQSFFF